MKIVSLAALCLVALVAQAQDVRVMIIDTPYLLCIGSQQKVAEPVLQEKQQPKVWSQDDARKYLREALEPRAHDFIPDAVPVLVETSRKTVGVLRTAKGGDALAMGMAEVSVQCIDSLRAKWHARPPKPTT